MYGEIDRLLGYEPGEFPTTFTGWMKLIHPDDHDRITKTMEQIIQNRKKEWDFRYRIRAKNGSYRHLLDRGSFIGFVGDRPNEGMGGVVDETEMILAQEKLQRALAKTEELKNRLLAESEYLQDEIKTKENLHEIVGHSRVMATTLHKVDLVAPTDSTVLLIGETGTGKELLARALHFRSNRNHRPLIKVDCGTLPSGLIESELFGHEKGAFTGAYDSKMGRFELANGGTIFLDEIGELPLDLQSKLLRVLEEETFQRLGSKREKNVDVRIIAASNRDLREEMRAGRLRSDLYYRLGVFVIESPPLRDRREDIPLLASFFLSKYAAAMGKKINSIGRASLDALVAYEWPGNIGELRNVIERSVILCTGQTLEVEDFFSKHEVHSDTGMGLLKQDLESVERSRILQALQESEWRIKGKDNAASRLGLAPSTLQSKMKKLGIIRTDHPRNTSTARSSAGN